jgi:peptidoglycan/xylan/chitin deacetylase (PgdA/CDA1 family)
MYFLINVISQKKQYNITSYENIIHASNSKTEINNLFAEKIPVITYHRIVNDWEKKKEIRHSSLSISRSAFKNQMKWLKKRKYLTLNCSEFYLWHQKKIEFPKKSVLITFDDGTIGQAKYAMPILKKYNMKGTSFIIGNLTYNNRKAVISYKKMREIEKLYPNFEFQSHTFSLHIYLKKDVYNKTLKDALIQKRYYDFKYLAYPFGFFTSDMVKAYNDSGIKMGFTYGKNAFATREQDIFRIRRIKVNSRESFAKFARWFID